MGSNLRVGSTEKTCRHRPWGPNTVQDMKRFVTDAVAAGDDNPQERDG